MTRSAQASVDATRSPEWTLLLTGARLQQTASDRSRIEHALAAGPDCDRLLSMALRHDVAPLLLRSLRNACPAIIPPSLLAGLRRATAANTLRNALLFDELARLLGLLKARHIDVVVLKGAALAETVYQDRSLRPMSDVDLLIRSEHLFEAEEILALRGYRFAGESPRAREWHHQNDYHVTYYKTSEGLPRVCIELHWHLDFVSRPFCLDLDGIWTRAVPASIAGVRTRILSPADVLLHVCLHVCKHGLTAGIRAYSDIAAIVYSYGSRLEWDTVTERACQWRVNPFAYLALRLARDLLDARVPDGALEDLVPVPFDSGLVDIAKSAVLEDPLSASLFPAFFRLRWSGSIRDQGAVVAELLSPDVIAARYGLRPGSREIWWKYPRRVADLCYRYGRHFGRFIRRGREAVTHADRRRRLAHFLQIFEPACRPTSESVRE